MVELSNSFDLASDDDEPAKADTSDDALVRRATDGDESAFEELFTRHRRRVARLAGRFFTQSVKIEDIVLEIFTKAYFALGDYAPQPNASFSAWLARIAVNTCHDHLRHAGRRPEQTAGSLTGDEDAHLHRLLHESRPVRDPESMLVSRDLAHKLLARLGPEDRLVLTLLDAEELSVAEIAEVTGWSKPKVKVRAFRARWALRRILSEFV